MRISDWSSDVCSSDLRLGGCASRSRPRGSTAFSWRQREKVEGRRPFVHNSSSLKRRGFYEQIPSQSRDRKSVGEGKSVSVRLDVGGRRIIKKNKKKNISNQYKSKHTT